MKRTILSLLFFALTAAPAQAHFIWIVPDAREGAHAKIVFSEGLEPDEAVPVEKIAATSLHVRDAAGRVVPLESKKGEHAYLVDLPDESPAVVGGVCRYGVLQRSQDKPFLVNYYPKLIRGEVQAAKAWDQLRLEIVPQGEGRFQVVFDGKPAAEAEVVVLASTADKKETLRTDASGEFKMQSAEPGLYGIRARHVEAVAGEHDGKKYEEARHYATLVFWTGGDRPGKTAANETPAEIAEPAAELSDYPPLPRAVSSFGAAVDDGWLYVYGGHCTKTHDYSTEAVLGAFRRLELSDPKAWEDLPSGPASQGLALVAHRGKVYRIGGMQPRNRPGEKADNHSLATCARFDTATGEWGTLPDLPEGRSSHDAVVVGDKLVVVGGWNMKGAGKEADWHSTALVLDLSKQPLQWEAVMQPFRRRALTAAPHDGKVYVIGGMAADSGIELTVNVYDLEKNVWTTGPDIPGPQGNGFTPASCVAGGRLYLTAADGKLVRLAGNGDAWEEVGRLKQPRIVHRMVAAHDNLLIAIGGAYQGDNVALTEAIEP